MRKAREPSDKLDRATDTCANRHLALDNLHNFDRSEVNFIEAAAAGASSSVSLVANIAANVIAFLSLLQFINATLTWLGQRVGIQQLTFQVTGCLYLVLNNLLVASR